MILPERRRVGRRVKTGFESVTLQGQFEGHVLLRWVPVSDSIHISIRTASKKKCLRKLTKYEMQNISEKCCTLHTTA
jgi:hypothetical protein